MKNKLIVACFLFLPFIAKSQTISETISRNLSIEGDWCAGTYMLMADFGRREGIWQWYKDGALLENEITEKINLAQYGNGKYVVMYKLKNNKVIYTDNYEFKTLPGPKADFAYDYLYAAGAISFKCIQTESYSNYTWHWNFGDGNTSTEANPIHLYKEEGTYQVTLTVTNETGCSNTISMEVVWKYPR